MADPRIETVNPATGEILERLDYASGSAVESALEAAASAFSAWRAQPFEQRADVLRRASAELRKRTPELAQTATREMGKPIAQARAEIEKCARACDHYAAHGAEYLADTVVESNASHSYVAFRPLGTLLAVMPWNFPYWQVFRAAAPAIAAGNVVLLKHASNVSRCALEIEAVFRNAGAPRGVFTTLLMHSDSVGKLVADSRIAAVTLTGSEGAGMSVASAAGHSLKKTVLELGGSDPFIVLADADLPAAVNGAVASRFQNNGQSCIAAKRFIVEHPVYDDFVAAFSQAAIAQRIGDPSDEQTQLGPVARDDLRDTLHAQVEASRARGARLSAGGRKREGRGFFYEATILTAVSPEMTVFTEETFGPAAAVTAARDAREAVLLANRTSFGLGASIWTKDTQRAQALAGDIAAGNVFVNGIVASDPRLPFGGVKRSGYGRELGSFGIREFVNIQTVWIGPEKAPR